MKLRKKALVSMAVLAVLVVGLAVPMAFAQDADEEEATTTQQAEREQHQQELAEALAEELGLDPDTVADAMDSVRGERTEERREDRHETISEWLRGLVEDGVLTQEQADALHNVHETGAMQALREYFREGGEGPFGGNGPLRGRGSFGGGHFGGWQFDGSHSGGPRGGGDVGGA